MTGSAELEAFVDESIRRSSEHGYRPTAFIGMRSRFGTVGAIDRLVRSGDLKGGFKRLEALGLLEWTVETAVLRFPGEFSREVRAAAEWRLAQARTRERESLRGRGRTNVRLSRPSVHAGRGYAASRNRPTRYRPKTSRSDKFQVEIQSDPR